MYLTRLHTLGIFLIALALNLIATNISAAADWQRVTLGDATENYDFPVYANHDLKGDLSKIRQVVMVMHGLHRNGDQYFATAQRLLEQSGRDPQEVLLIAPNFPGKQDQSKGFTQMPLWGTRDWAAGLDAQGVAFSLSSFKVMDDLVRKVTESPGFEGVATVIIAGHSAGGQFVQRYAALNQVDETIRTRGLDLRYVVANPSSFLYFTPQRPEDKTFKDYPAEQCPDFNQYRYGMENMIPYAKIQSSQEQFKRYSHRAVTYLMGGNDTDPNHKLLDKTCPALAQGATRLSRAKSYIRYERFLVGRATKINHLAYEVQDVGHNQEKMFGSSCGMMSLFQSEAPKDSHAAACQPYLF